MPLEAVLAEVLVLELVLLELLLEEVLLEPVEEEVLPELPSALALTSTPVELPPRKNLGDLADALFS